MNPAFILIDNREGSKDLVRFHCLQGATLTNLESGDITFQGKDPSNPGSTVEVGIELKSYADFCTSVKSKRLTAVDGQLAKMLEAFDRSYLLIYGMDAPAHWVSQRYSLPVQSTIGALHSIAEADIRVVTVPSKARAAEWIAQTYKWYSKPKHSTMFSGPRQMNKGGDAVSKMLGKKKREERVLFLNLICQLDGVGIRSALAALKHFGSALEALNASHEEWMKVDGIGKITAKKIYDSLRKKV
jgi:ERCC4-type nuclease